MVGREMEEREEVSGWREIRRKGRTEEKMERKKARERKEGRKEKKK